MLTDTELPGMLEQGDIEQTQVTLWTVWLLLFSCLNVSIYSQKMSYQFNDPIISISLILSLIYGYSKIVYIRKAHMTITKDIWVWTNI